MYLACGSTDSRKSIDGLAVLVKEEFELDPFSPSYDINRTSIICFSS
ncbi:IS66 family insertion sequence element accessory protein TnpB [Aneurinibacillus terranovensis]